MEGFRQVESRFVEWQPMDRRPQVQDVPFGRAIGIEALKHVLAEMHEKDRPMVPA